MGEERQTNLSEGNTGIQVAIDFLLDLFLDFSFKEQGKEEQQQQNGCNGDGNDLD